MPCLAAHYAPVSQRRMGAELSRQVPSSTGARMHGIFNIIMIVQRAVRSCFGISSKTAVVVAGGVFRCLGLNLKPRLNRKMRRFIFNADPNMVST